ncbi:glycosyltransferase family 2 protein [Vulgatibacter sp.]|uniref:glycosyltransferase family 2 protein n=1 Tax=Vulgatibacter sp. TaxID=1971226 RepID=UPI003566C2FB
MVVVFVHLLVLLVFVNRYFLGRWLRRIRGASFDERMEIEGREPSVAIVVPMFNEGEGIYRTIHSLLAQDYPADRLRIVVVDDCSTDDSHSWAWRAARESDRVTVLRNPENMGKRRSINHAVRRTEAEIIVSVDSDVVVDQKAVRELVARFTDPKIAAVGGRVHVINVNENWLTRMQAIKYWFGYEYLKELERVFRSVMCLSGCLTAYRRHVLLELEPILEDRSVLGVPIKYGEDRFLTRQIVKAGWQTVMTLDAVSYTVAPPTLTKYFSQQLRWRRSNLIDYIGGLSHAWKLHPVVAIHYFATFAMLVAYPVMVVESLASQSFWPLTMLHAGILALLGTIYWLKTRDMPPEMRVSPIWFLSMAALMPVTYLLLTPLAFFTLDSGSWETRGKPAPAEQEQEEQAAVDRLDVGPAT